MTLIEPETYGNSDGETCCPKPNTERVAKKVAARVVPVVLT